MRARVRTTRAFDHIRKVLEMTNLLKRLHKDEEGATMVEYGLIVALIAVVCIAAVILIGNSLSGQFNSVASDI